MVTRQVHEAGGKLDDGLGITAGWIHRAWLKMKQVKMTGGFNYERIGDEGWLISCGEKHESPEWLARDNIVLCAGQLPLRELANSLEAQGKKAHIIGGALVAGASPPTLQSHPIIFSAHQQRNVST